MFNFTDLKNQIKSLPNIVKNRKLYHDCINIKKLKF